MAFIYFDALCYLLPLPDIRYYFLQLWASPTPSPLLPTLRALVQAGICMGLYLYLSPQFPLSRFSEPLYYEWGFWHRLFYQYMSGFTARWKYYFIWSISEAAIIISGLGFTGWSESSPPKAKWDRAKNVDVLGVELAGSSVQLPLVWNIQVSTWLRYCKFCFLIKSITSPTLLTYFVGHRMILLTEYILSVWKCVSLKGIERLHPIIIHDCLHNFHEPWFVHLGLGENINYIMPYLLMCIFN